MNCMQCGEEMINTTGGNYYCPKCGAGINDLVYKPSKQLEYIKQEPYVDDNGIWVPLQEYAPEGCASYYKLVISKEMFVEAYNKWIKGTEFDNKDLLEG